MIMTAEPGIGGPPKEKAPGKRPRKTRKPGARPPMGRKGKPPEAPFLLFVDGRRRSLHTFHEIRTQIAFHSEDGEGGAADGPAENISVYRKVELAHTLKSQDTPDAESQACVDAFLAATKAGDRVPEPIDPPAFVVDAYRYHQPEKGKAKLYYVDRYDADEFELERVRVQHGGGRYSFRLKDKRAGGKTVVSRNAYIEGAPLFEPPEGYGPPVPRSVPIEGTFPPYLVIAGGESFECEDAAQVRHVISESESAKKALYTLHGSMEPMDEDPYRGAEL